MVLTKGQNDILPTPKIGADRHQKLVLTDTKNW